jgi:SAM-dependent methyltransferase
VNGADPQRWSEVADGWQRLWEDFTEPVWDAILTAAPVGPHSRVLDVGCGAGGLLTHVTGKGARAYGIDPAPDMLAHARNRLPEADLRTGDAEHLPWPDRHFHLVTSINALQFADDTLDALAECARVTAPDGHVAIANWAEAHHNDLSAIENAVADAYDEPDGDLRVPGGLESLLTEGGLTVVASGLVALPWTVPDDDTLIEAVLLGEDPDTVAATRAVVVAAATPFRTGTGGYRLMNSFRYAVARP